MDRDEKICFYQGRDEIYHSYLLSKGREGCIGCIKDELNQKCVKKYMVSRDYYENIMIDTIKIMKSVESKVE
jgi:hypothetical protein